jgi:hypothetical protein
MEISDRAETHDNSGCDGGSGWNATANAYEASSRVGAHSAKGRGQALHHFPKLVTTAVPRDRISLGLDTVRWFECSEHGVALGSRQPIDGCQEGCPSYERHRDILRPL